MILHPLFRHKSAWSPRKYLRRLMTLSRVGCVPGIQKLFVQSRIVLTVDDKVDVVEEEYSAEEEGSKVNTPEEDVELEPGRVHPRHQHHHGEDELEDLGPASVA